ncbi:hypothetical protein BUALT_Bualt17G0051300 [Buddleja alternifolia]|uniref:RRM domain-containing protein n=1 Tax=Buddleja alternifolia TaxID=168488 RepID=A0AAV6WGS3_9LAMI|nr:hypothetical protein BUALT_Bualt17G0051300 [Buddleja alternifolia]
MLNLCKFPTQLHYNTLFQNPISQFLQFPSKPHLNFHSVHGKLRTGLFSNALKTKKKGGFSVSEMDGPDEFDDEFDGSDYDDDGDDEVIVPLKNMKEWIENRPRGFGEGKEYDTSIEDKLMEEIEESRKAQLVNVNKLKNTSVESNSKKKQDKGPTQIQDGFRVRLVNLPKKKNIHKDLKLAFKEVSGILNIVPVVSGNEKTRDPVCKGLAFVDFKYQDEANRFVQNFSGKSISFGKVQKQIRCEMTSFTSQKPASDQSVKSNSTPLPVVFNLDNDSIDESVSSELDDADERHVLAQFEDDGEIEGTKAVSDSSLAEESEIEEESAMESPSLKQERKLKMNEKKAASKRRKDKIPKLNIPGSSNRLKIREKEMLSGVFSKYGANATLTVKEQSR